MKEGVEVEDYTHPHGSRELESKESRPELFLNMHLTNSTPTPSLCMTGRGESKG